ncbi:MAG: hypothetical protein KKF41_15625 [Actinobacteria bacterium]|nr:hypothetical protein [Actinomycetota bacterium]MBU1943832.1 hypothetical protein [Actinomycetota bacterium]MBU2689007.1 hypothetical protein [Actinomycetota bacterium]
MQAGLFFAAQAAAPAPTHDALHTVLAIAIAIGGALLLNWAIYLQKKAVVELPPVKAKISWELVKTFITNGPWMFAQLINVSGFALYAVALAMAPVSIVEPLIASGVVLLAYLAIKNLGERPRRIDYVAIGMSVFGVVCIALSLLEGVPKDELRHPADMWIFTGVALGLAVIIPLVMRGSSAKRAAGLGISVGLLFGSAAVFTRLLMMEWGDHWGYFALFAVLCVATYLPGFIVLQAALQQGQATVVAPVYNGVQEFIPIVIGMVALNEKFPENDFLAALRIFGFVLIIVGTIILSQRAEGEEAPAVAVEETPAESGGEGV